MGFIRIYIGDELLNQFELTADTTTIGRSADNDIVLSDNGVSRNHAKIVKEGNDFIIEDNASSNGVFVNQQKVERQKLHFKDEIQIYKFVLKFMPIQRLQGNSQIGMKSVDSPVDGTMMVSMQEKDELERLRSQKISTWLRLFNDKSGLQRYDMNGPSISIGKDRDSDIRVGGFFAPATAARIIRQGPRYLITPAKRGKVVLNDKPIDQEQQLHDGDHIVVRGLEMEFYHRIDD